jgi:hypothetical protein
MPYPIKSTAGDSLLPILRKQTYGNIGVNQGGYGSTASTGFWNGKPPNVGGYVVYVGNLLNSPTMYVVATDNQLITLSNTLGGGSNTTIGLALNYFFTTINIICFDVEPLNVVTEGLYFYVDAGFACSYPRIGTTWQDISRGFNTGTLINGPTYSSAGGGCIVSDGSDDGVTIVDDIDLDLTNFTLDGWVWFNQHKDYGSLLVKGPGGAGQLFNYCFFFYASSIVCGFGDGSNFYSAGVLTTPNVPINTWHHIVGVYNSVAISFYLNGVLMQSNPIVATPYQNTNNLNVIQSDYPIDGKVISAKIYNRALSLTEIKQNYYAGLQRLIPVNDIILWIDGENTNTRVITPTTAYDRSSLDYNGSLMNGMGLSHRNAGTSFSFDGGDDYINLGSPYRIGISVSYLTVSIWFKITSSPVGSNTLIKFGAANSGWLIGFSSSGLYYNLYTTTNTYAGGGISLPSLNVWSNLTFTYGGTGTFIMYLNGVIVVNTTASVGTIVNGGSTVVNIGRDGSGSGSNYFKGDMSIVRVFADTLTSAQVLNIYNAGKQRHGL